MTETRGPRPSGILAVEDDAVVQRGIARAVGGEASVGFAGTGAAALQALAGGALPAFVLLDFVLPDMDGIQVLRRLRAEARTRFVPVVMFSSVRDARRVEEALAAGANSWVVKRDDPQAFADCIRAVCRYWLHVNLPPAAPSAT